MWLVGDYRFFQMSGWQSVTKYLLNIILHKQSFDSGPCVQRKCLLKWINVHTTIFAFLFGFRVDDLKNFIAPTLYSILISCAAYLVSAVIRTVNLFPWLDTGCLVHRFADIRFSVINTSGLLEPSSIHNSKIRKRSISISTEYSYRFRVGGCNFLLLTPGVAPGRTATCSLSKQK